MTVSRTVSTGRSSRTGFSSISSAGALTSGSSAGIGEYSQCSGKRVPGGAAPIGYCEGVARIDNAPPFSRGQTALADHSLLPQRSKRVYLCGVARGQVAGQQRHRTQKQTRAAEDQRIARAEIYQQPGNQARSRQGQNRS